MRPLLLIGIAAGLWAQQPQGAGAGVSADTVGAAAVDRSQQGIYAGEDAAGAAGTGSNAVGTDAAGEANGAAGTGDVAGTDAVGTGDAAATDAVATGDATGTGDTGALGIDPVKTQPPGGRRAFGMIPNYRTADRSLENTKISTRQKFAIASKDSFDYPVMLFAAAYAGFAQAGNQHASFGQGMKGYGHRLITGYTDQVAGNLFTEAIFPTLLHQDPRYFRRGSGAISHRIGYAVSRMIWTHNDAGGTGFNYSEWLGNASSVAISNLYYNDGRTWENNVGRLFIQVGTDAISQLIKEFWPDVQRKLFHHDKTCAADAPPGQC